MPRLDLLGHNIGQVAAHAHWTYPTMEHVGTCSKIRGGRL